MAQKVHPTNFRSLRNYEDSNCLQQTYGSSYTAYTLKEHLAVTSYIKRFFKNFGLRLHSFRYSKTSKSTGHLTVKYVPVFLNVESKNSNQEFKSLNFSTLEKAFFYGLSKLLPRVPLRVSFFNLTKRIPKKKEISTHFNTPLFSALELDFYLKALLTVKGGAFFLAGILSTKLYMMRSRIDRKSQNRFLVFIRSLLSHILTHNLINIKGLRVSIKGRINGAPRSKVWVASEGKMSLQCIDTKIDYYYLPSQTVYGTFGVKVWINYGK